MQTMQTTSNDAYYHQALEFIQDQHSQVVAALEQQAMELHDAKQTLQDQVGAFVEKNKLLTAELRQTKQQLKDQTAEFKITLQQQQDYLATYKRASKKAVKEATKEAAKGLVQQLAEAHAKQLAELAKQLAEAKDKTLQYEEECLMLRSEVKALQDMAETDDAASMLPEKEELITQREQHCEDGLIKCLSAAEEESRRSTVSITRADKMTTATPVMAEEADSKPEDDYAMEEFSNLFSSLAVSSPMQKQKQPKYRKSVVMTVMSTGCSSWVHNGKQCRKRAPKEEITSSPTKQQPKHYQSVVMTVTSTGCTSWTHNGKQCRKRTAEEDSESPRRTRQRLA